MSSTDDPLEVRVSTVGRAMPEIECKIIDPDTGRGAAHRWKSANSWPGDTT